MNGIDVSYHNGDINWSAVKAAGIDYALIRVGYRGMSNGGLFDDSKYRANIQGALNAGLRVGVYIFSQATTQAEAAEEANYLKNQGYNLIAEGVEEKKEVELLNQWGIDLIQGYYFSRPLCEEELLRQIVD